MFNLKFSTAILVGAVTLLSGGYSLPVLGQDTMLEELIVSARRRDESLQDVPLSVTAYTGEALEKMGTPDIVAVAASIPNTTLKVSRGTNTTLTAFIRGVGQQDPVAGFEAGVGLYLDDVYLNRPQGTVLDIYDVERIEVLRGPQGTLYGRNTVGGAVKYVTKGLADEATFKVKATLGNYSQADLVLTGSTPLSDTFRVGGSIASFNRDGYGDNLFTGGENYDKDIMAFRGSFEWDVSDLFQIRFTADHSEDDSSPKQGHRLTDAVLTDNPVLDNVYDTRAGITEVSPAITVNSVEQTGFALVAEYSVNDELTFKSVTSHRDDLSESPIDFDSLPDNTFDVPVIYDNKQFSQEFQFTYVGEKMQGIAGIYYLDANAFDAFDVVLGDLFGPGVDFTSFTLGDVDTKTWAIYADVDFDLSDQLKLSVGARYTDDKRDASIIRTGYFGSVSPYFTGDDLGVDPFVGSRTDSKFTPKLSLSWMPNDNTNFYGSYSQGFKGGSFDPRGDYSNPEIQGGFAPEIVDAYELGVKANSDDGRTTANFALFFSDYTDIQIPGSVAIDSNNDGVDDNFVGTVTNAGKAEIKGIEFEFNTMIGDSLQSTLNLGYIDAEYQEWIVNDVNIADTKVFQNTPERTAYWSLSYFRDMTIGDSSGEISLSGSIAYTSEVNQFEDPNMFLDQGAYSLVDASLVWTSDDGVIQVGVHGKNLSDKEYKVAGYNFPTLGDGGAITAFYGNPRTVTGTISYNF